jgi:hypothetical protein
MSIAIPCFFVVAGAPRCDLREQGAPTLVLAVVELLLHNSE